MLAAPWYCDNCRRINSSFRYQCQQCRRIETYDLCENCIGAASMIHPNHSFALVRQAVINTNSFNTAWSYPTLPSMAVPQQTLFSSYMPLSKPTLKITYEYS